MSINTKTALITGGGSGIGFQVAKRLSEQGYHVIITGRNKQKLDEAAAKLNNITAIACDITDAYAVSQLASHLQNEYPGLSLLVNNAGRASVYKLGENVDAVTIAREEMQTNLFGVIDLTEKLLPLLKSQPEAAIINVSSIVVFAPSSHLPTYSATKAALHSYTQALRMSLADTNVKVFELMPPLVDTELSKEIGGAANGIPASQVADELIQGLQENCYEIHVGNTKDLYQLFLSSPAEALKVMNPMGAEVVA